MAVTSSKTVSVTPPVLTFSKTWQTASLGVFRSSSIVGNAIGVESPQDFRLEGVELVELSFLRAMIPLKPRRQRCIEPGPGESSRGTGIARIPSQSC